LKFYAVFYRIASDCTTVTLRGIGKRNRALNIQAIEFSQQIARLDSRVARWIASDALRELTSSKIQAKFGLFHT
jgi:hypothetical protein